MRVFNEKIEFYKGAYDQGKDLVIMSLLLFFVLVPALTSMGQAEFSWFDLSLGVWIVLTLFRYAMRAAEYEDKLLKAEVTHQVNAYGYKFMIGLDYLHVKSGKIYELLTITNAENTVEFPAHAVYRSKETGKVYSRDLMRFGENFKRYETPEEE